MSRTYGDTLHVAVLVFPSRKACDDGLFTTRILCQTLSTVRGTVYLSHKTLRKLYILFFREFVTLTDEILLFYFDSNDGPLEY